MFLPGSRYHSVPDATYEDAHGRTVTYKLPRPAGAEPTRQTHVVVAGDRLDLLAYAYFSDPELFWRLADANRAMWPEELLATLGRDLIVPWPQG